MLKIKAATNHELPGRTVLILGERAVAHQIGSTLARHGFEVLDESKAGFPKPKEVRDHPEILSERLKVLIQETPELVALHPGVGPWAERPELASAAEAHGLVFLGPSVRSMNMMGNRLTFLSTCETLGIPHLVFAFQPLTGIRELKRWLQQEKVRYPFVLKSVWGHGAGIGVKVVESESDLTSEVPLWQEELREQFGEGVFFAEKYVDVARYLSLSFVRTLSGETHFFPVVDSSLQNLGKKLVEMCPAFHLDGRFLLQMQEWAKKIADELRYVGIGSLEFLMDGDRLVLIQGLPRLSSHFPLLDYAASSDVVGWQLLLAGLTAKEPAIPRIEGENHAIQCRIYAEDSIRQIPLPGRVEVTSDWKETKIGSCHFEWVAPAPPFVVPDQGTGIVGFLVGKGPSRQSILEAFPSAFQKLWISGTLVTNEGYLKDLISHPWVKEGIFHASFVEEEFLPGWEEPSVFRTIAATISERLCAETEQVIPRFRWLVSEHWTRSKPERLEWIRQPELLGDQGLVGELKVGMSKVRVATHRVLSDVWIARVGGFFFRVRSIRDETVQATKGQIVLRAQTSGRVESVLAPAGHAVEAKESLLHIRSLGKLIPHRLPIRVRVLEWNVGRDSKVKMGEALGLLQRLTEESP